MITSTPQTSRCLVCFYYKCFMIVDLVVWFNCCFWYLSLGLLDYCKIIITTILVSYFWRSWLFNTTGLLSARPVITCLLNFWEKKWSSIRGLTVSCVFGSICTIYLRPALRTLHTVSTVKSWTDALLAKLYQVLQMPRGLDDCSCLLSQHMFTVNLFVLTCACCVISPCPTARSVTLILSTKGCRHCPSSRFDLNRTCHRLAESEQVLLGMW